MTELPELILPNVDWKQLKNNNKKHKLMPKKYIFAIDETGSFLIHGNDKSFACGVQIKDNIEELKAAYMNLYEALGFPAPTPTDRDGLLKLSDEEMVYLQVEDKARFHFNKLGREERDKCKNIMLPLVNRVFISKGKPSLYANNQNWWLISIVVIIREWLKKTKFEVNSEIEVWIDNRNQKVWGILESEQPEFKEYHKILKQMIDNSVRRFVPSGVGFKVEFKSDTSSYFINLADITCGIIRSDGSLLKEKTTECPCQAFIENADAVQHLERNPIVALSVILQEVTNNELCNINHVGEAFKRLRDNESYEMAFDMFHDMLKFKIEERSRKSLLVSLKPMVDLVCKELRDYALVNRNLSRRLDLMVLMMEYYSHIGSIEVPFAREQFMNVLRAVKDSKETRLLRKWEKLVSYSLREAQILFNNYRFEDAKSTFEQLWDSQDKLINALPTDILWNDERKDEHTTAILGTLAQAYAYAGDLDSAIEHFKLSKEYVIRTGSLTDSFLFNVYLRQKDLDGCRTSFELQTGMTAEEYLQKKDFKNQWNLLSYCKLRALELYINKNTDLTLPLEYIQEHAGDEYPFPLILKWAAVSLYLENYTGNKVLIDKLLHNATIELMNEGNGFTIKALVLPVIQCYALVNNQNPYHAKYAEILRMLKGESASFVNFIQEKEPRLESVKNEADMWNRAMMLPFIYS